MLKPLIVIGCAVSASLGTCAAAAAVAQALAPAYGPARSAALPKAADGHFWARAQSAGRNLDLLVDTGASAVALTPADARTLGLDPAALLYDRAVLTAAGPARAAPVMLERLSVGAVAVERVPALVVREGLGRSLLGMSFLGRLRGFSADGTTLTLRE